MKQTSSKQIAGALMAMAGGSCWGLSGTVGQFMFTRKGLSSLWVTPIRLFLSGVLLLAYAFLRSPKQAVAPLKERQDRVDLAIYGILGISMCQMLYFGTIQLSSAGVATILQDLSPVFILLCGCVAGRRAPRLQEVGSIVLALAGVSLLVTHGNIRDLAVSPAALLCGTACAVGVTVYNVYPKRLLSRYPVPLLQAWSFLAGGLLMIFVFRPWEYAVVIDWQVIAGMAAVIIIGNLLAFNLYMTGVRLIGPEKAILYGFAEPLTAAVLGVVWLGNTFTLWDAAGFVCVFLMLVLLSVHKTPADA